MATGTGEMSYRKQIATQVLNGLLANQQGLSGNVEKLVAEAFKYADAVLDYDKAHPRRSALGEDQDS